MEGNSINSEHRHMIQLLFIHFIITHKWFLDPVWVNMQCAALLLLRVLMFLNTNYVQFEYY